MAISESAAGGVVVLGLTGRLDALTVEQARDKLLASAGASAARLLLDCARLVYVSSAGLRLVMQVAMRVAAAKGKVVLCALPRQVQQVFDLAGFAALIPIFATREEALAALG